MILAGDVGGTNARFALFEPGGRARVRQDTLRSADHASLESAVRAFLGPSPPAIEAATFGIAGPVVAGKAWLTNLGWEVDARALGAALGIPKVALLNDLVALGFGALTVPRDKLRPLRGEAVPASSGANVAVIAAGTGLGEAVLVWDGDAHTPCATEGGHVDFAPRDRLEFELFEFLQERFGGHVSYERIVAGPGIGNLYDFFTLAKKMPESPEAAAQLARASDRNKEIFALAKTGKSQVCAKVLATFASLYGAEAGNLALKSLATGGVFVCGGIAANYAEEIARGGFMAAFTAKGRFTELLGKIPVAIVLDTDIGLAGSAYYAAREISAG
jgi:glucokinase